MKNLLFLTLTLALFACGGSPEEAEEATQDPVTTETADEMESVMNDAAEIDQLEAEVDSLTNNL